MRRALVVVRIVGAAALLAGATTLVMLPAMRSAAAEEQPEPVPPAPADVAVALHRAGLQPDAIAAAGLSAAETTTVVVELKDAFVEGGGELALADAVHAEARRQHDGLRRRIEAGLASAEEVASFPAAAQALAAAAADREAALSGLFDAATGWLGPAKREALATIRATRAQWDQDWPYLCTVLDEPQRVALRDALANERIAAESGETPDPEAQALLQQVRAIPAVSAAQAGLQANLAAVKAAWEDALD